MAEVTNEMLLQAIKELNVNQQDTTKILQEHEKILLKHSKKMDSFTEVQKEHSKKIQEHSNKMDQFTVGIVNVLIVLMNS